MEQHKHGTSYHNGNYLGHIHMENEVNILVDYKENFILINLKDNQNHVPELEVAHEKIMHLIIVHDITVELKIDSLVTNKPTILTYKILGAEPEPYLGALGHHFFLKRSQ